MKNKKAKNPITNNSELWTWAKRYRMALISTVPILCDGSKRPAVKWKPFTSNLPSKSELKTWFGSSDRAFGFGCVTGKVSNGLHCLDFDDPRTFDKWKMDPLVEPLLEELVVIATPRSPSGKHVIFRCASISKTCVLAKASKHPLIELKGENAMFVGIGSPKSTHSSNRSYLQIAGPEFPEDIPFIRSKQKDVLIAAAIDLDQSGILESKIQSLARLEMQTHTKQEVDRSSSRPGDVLNKTDNWEYWLRHWGWTQVSNRLWRRPRKREGISASLFQSEHVAGRRLLAVWTTNSLLSGDEHPTIHSLFSAFSTIEANGNYHLAASLLGDFEPPIIG